MNRDPRMDDRLFWIIGRVCNGNATESEVDQLGHILAADPAARSTYAEYMLLHAELYWLQDSLGETTTGRGANRTSHGDDSRAWGMVAKSLTWIGTIAATLLLGWFLGSHDFFARSEPAGRPSRPGSTQAGREGAEPEERPTVAIISGTRNCRWDEGSGSVGYGSPLAAGRRLHLLEGLAEITFERGARVILQAPAVFDVADEGRSMLHRGRLTAAVPNGAEGFRVDLQRLSLIDRGTEFGVLADENGKAEVQVFEGLVEGYFHDDRGETIRTARWTAAQSVRIDPRNADYCLSDGTVARFVRSLSPSTREELYAFEEFDYPSGPLGGQNGGYGWGGPWVDLSASGNSSETNRVAAGNLKVDGLIPVGNHAALVGQGNRIRRVLGTSLGGVFDTAGLVEDEDGVRLVGKDGTTVYVSFCQRVSAVGDGFYGVELHRGDGNGNRVLCVGNGASDTAYGISSEVNGGARSTFRTLGKEPTDVTFIVVRIDFGQNDDDRLVVFRDPQSLVREAECEVDAELTGNFAFDRISGSNFDGQKSHAFDRLRLGTSFTAVTDHHLVTPEHSVVQTSIRTKKILGFTPLMFALREPRLQSTSRIESDNGRKMAAIVPRSRG